MEFDLQLVQVRIAKIEALIKEARMEKEMVVRKFDDKISNWESKLQQLNVKFARMTGSLQEGSGGRARNGHKANGFTTPDPATDEEEDVFVTPQMARGPAYEEEDDEDEDYENEDYSEDDDEDDDEVEEQADAQRPASRNGATTLVPREVAMRQHRAATTVAAPPGFTAPAPPGFDLTPRAPAGAAPPGFESNTRSPPGFSRSRPANGVQEDRGAAQLRHNDLRSLIANKRLAATPASEGGSEEGGKSDGYELPRRLQTPAPKQGDLRDQLNRMRYSSPPVPPKKEAPKNEAPSGHASESARPQFDSLFPAPARAVEEAPAPPPRPRGNREWDAGKSEMVDQPLPPPLPPPQRTLRNGRQEAPVYQPPRRDWDAGAEQRGDSPDQAWERRDAEGTVIGRSESEYVAPDPADLGLVDFDDFPGLTIAENRPAWDGDAAKMDENFPALGAGPAAAPKGAWGAGDAAARLQKLSVQAGLGKPAAPTVDIAVMEQKAGLRLPGDNAPDKERRQQMRSKKDFNFEDVVKRRGGGSETVNVVSGLELHKGLLNAQEQARVVAAIEGWEEAGRAGLLRGRTFSAPRKSMKGKGRVTVQFGCCYNYAVDKEGREPGIIAEEVVEPMPPLLQALVHRLVRWGVLPKARAPDSAIINIYDQEDCIPPHIDHHDFSRPFCTISLLSEQAIMFGVKLVPLGPGQFGGRHCTIPLPVGSCLVLKGNGADVAMHCVPPVTARRMSITLRKMGDRHAERVKAQVERITKNPRATSRWADDEVQDSPRRYGADDYEDYNSRPPRRRVVW